MEKIKKVSVIICCYSLERLRDTIEAIESVKSQTEKSNEIVVVVDHNPELLNILQTQLSPDIKLVLGEGAPGLSEARNTGINASSSEIVAFHDDDAIAEKDWLEKLILPFKDSRVVAVGGKALPQWPKGSSPSWFPEELNWILGCTYKGFALTGNQIRNVLGCNMAFRKSAFEKAGLFRSETGRVGTSTGCGEEADLCLRISKNITNALILYEERAIIHHKVPLQRLTWRYLWQRSFNEGLYKSIVKRLASGSFKNTLSTEDSYIRYLIFKSIPRRLVQFWKYKNNLQVIAILSCMTATTYGYLLGIWKYKKALS